MGKYTVEYLNDRILRNSEKKKTKHCYLDES